MRLTLTRSVGAIRLFRSTRAQPVGASLGRARLLANVCAAQESSLVRRSRLAQPVTRPSRVWRLEPSFGRAVPTQWHKYWRASQIKYFARPILRARARARCLAASAAPSARRDQSRKRQP